MNIKIDENLIIFAGVLFFIGAALDIVVWVTTPTILITLFGVTYFGFPNGLPGAAWWLMTVAIFILGIFCIRYGNSTHRHRVAFFLIGIIGLVLSGACYYFGGLFGLFSIIPSILAIATGVIADRIKA